MVDYNNLDVISHIGYIVKNINESVNFFKNLLGIDEFFVYDFKPLTAYINGIKINDCFLKIGMGSMRNDMKIELIQPMINNKESQIKSVFRQTTILHHIAFQVSDYLLWRRYFIEELDAKIIFEAEIEDEIIGYRKSFYALIKDKAGIIEITTKPFNKTIKF